MAASRFLIHHHQVIGYSCLFLFRSPVDDEMEEEIVRYARPLSFLSVTALSCFSISRDKERWKR